MIVASHRERAYAHIRQKMLLGEIPVGRRLSPEGLAREIGISRTPMREALAQLGAEGLLEQVPQYGTFVKRVSREELQELYELREVLEGIAAERAAARITSGQLRELEQVCDQMHRMCRRLRDEKWNNFPLEQEKQWTLLDARFHILILAVSDSARLRKIVADLKLLTNVFGRLWMPHDRYRPWGYYITWTAHLRVTKAMKRRDGPAARRHMSDHIHGGRKAMLEHYWPEDAAHQVYDLNASIHQVVDEVEKSSQRKND